MRAAPKFEYQIHLTGEVAVAFRFEKDGPLRSLLTEDEMIKCARFYQTKHPTVRLYPLKRRLVEGVPMEWESYS